MDTRTETDWSVSGQMVGPTALTEALVAPHTERHTPVKLHTDTPSCVPTDFPGGLDNIESTCNVGDLASIPGLGRSPGGGHGNPLQYSSLENPHGQRSLVGYSPWGHKESDVTV